MVKSDESIKKEKDNPTNRHCWLDIYLVVIIFILILVPFALIITFSEFEPYHVVAGNPVRNAAQAAQITINSEKDTQWNVPGATGGKTFVLSDSQGNIVTIETQAFDSAESRDAIVRTHNSNVVGKGKPVGELFVVGQHLIYITPANSQVFKELLPELKKFRNL